MLLTVNFEVEVNLTSQSTLYVGVFGLEVLAAQKGYVALWSRFSQAPSNNTLLRDE
jgi:hypothetical protein